MKKLMKPCLWMLAMKKLFAVLILSVGLTPAWAEWVIKGGSDNVNLYMKSEVIRLGGTIKGWVMLDVIPGGKQPFLSLIQLHEARCNTGQKRILQLTSYNGQMGGGEVITSRNEPNDWSYPTPGSLDETIFETLCAKK